MLSVLRGVTHSTCESLGGFSCLNYNKHYDGERSKVKTEWERNCEMVMRVSPKRLKWF